jgi:hypothetical protein
MVCSFKAESLDDMGVCGRCSLEFRVQRQSLSGAPKQSRLRGYLLAACGFLLSFFLMTLASLAFGRSGLIVSGILVPPFVAYYVTLIIREWRSKSPSGIGKYAVACGVIALAAALAAMFAGVGVVCQPTPTRSLASLRGRYPKSPRAPSRSRPAHASPGIAASSPA